MTSYEFFMKPGAPSLKSMRLLDQVRERIRYMQYSLSTEKVYLYWVRFLNYTHVLKAAAGGTTSPLDALPV